MRATAIVLMALVVAPATARSQTQVRTPWVGVTVITRTESAPRPVRLHVAQIDTKADGIRFLVSPPGGSREVVRQTTRAFLEESGAQLAVNAHFFLPFPSTDADAVVVGFAASNGRVFSAFESPEQRYALVSDAPALAFDRQQRPFVVHRDERDPSGRRTRERARVWNAVAGSAQIVTAGAVTVPTYRDEAHVDGRLEPGGPTGYSNARSWNDVLTARTVVGVSRDRRVVTLFTVDRSADSQGMRLAEIAELLVRDYAVWDALNLDGGGSTSLAWRNPVTGIGELLNVSADSPGGRAVATSLAVFARPIR